MHNGLTFNFGSAKVCSPANFRYVSLKTKVYGLLQLIKLFEYGRASGSAGSGGSAFCFPYNSVTVRRILFKFGRFRQ